MWLLGQATRGTVTLKTPQGAQVSLDLESAKIRRRAILQGGHPAILIQIQARDSIREIGGNLKLDQPQTLTELDNLLEARIRSYAQLALQQAQESKVDPFEFGRLVAQSQPKVWQKVYRDWPDTFARMPVILQIHAMVQRTGNLITPPVRGGV